MEKFKNITITSLFIFFIALGASDGPGSSLKWNILGLAGSLVLLVPMLKIIKKED